MFSVLLILLVSSSIKGLSQELQQNAIFNEDKNSYQNQQLQKFDLENEQFVQSGPVVFERDRREILEEGSGDDENVETESPTEADSNKSTTKMEQDETGENKTESSTIKDETTKEIIDAPDEVDEKTDETKQKTAENDASNNTEHSLESQNEDTTKSPVNPLNVPEENMDNDEKKSNVSETTTKDNDSEFNPNIRRLNPKVDSPMNVDGDKMEEHKDHAEIIDDKKEKKDNETSQIRAGDKDKDENSTQSGAGNNVLIILVVVVIVAGAGCFGYKYCKSKQEEPSTGDNPGTELKEIKVDQANANTKQAPTTSAEMKPLLDNKNHNQNITDQKETKERKENDVKAGENAVNENTPCNGRNNDN